MPLNIQLLPPGCAAPAARAAALALALLAGTGPLVAQQAEGDRAWDQGRREDARAAYLRVLDHDPGAYLANLRLGLLLAWAGRYDSALVHLARARATDPADPEARVVQARVLAWSGRLPAAAARYDSVLATDPRNVEALIGLGYVYHWQRRDGPAARMASNALALAPNSQDARDLRDAVRAATQTALELSATWSNDSDRNTAWWQTAEVGAPVAAGVRIFAGVNLLEASDPIRDAVRVGGEAGFTWALGDVQFGGAAGARHLTPETADPRTVFTYRGRFSWRPAPAYGASIGYARYPFDEIASLFDRELDLDALEAGFDASPIRGLSLYGGGGAVWISDGNTRTWVGAGLTGTFARRFFAGVYGRTLGYDERGVGYFSPDRFNLLEAVAGYTLDSGPWSGRLSGGLGGQEIGRRGATQTEWHLEARLGRRWGVGNRVEAFGLVTNSAVSSTTGAFRYRSAGLLARIGL
jgi:tetratricopeptide (TPR) repeat protein